MFMNKMQSGHDVIFVKMTVELYLLLTKSTMLFIFFITFET
jgi:hypothetical protein